MTRRRAEDANPSDWVYIRPNETRSYGPKKVGGRALAQAVKSRLARQLSTQERAILSTFDGDVGRYWERIFEGSRKIGCLIPITHWGKKLVKHMRMGGRSDLVVERAYRDQDAGIKDAVRDQLLRSGEHAARVSLAAARRALREVSAK